MQPEGREIEHTPPRWGSHLVGDDKWRPIPSLSVRQETIGLFVAHNLLRLGIEAQRPAQTI